MNNIKQICTRLIELWEDDCEIDWEIAQLRTELAKPKPEGPTPSAELLPAAQAVLNAFRADWKDEHLKQDVKCLAAALRAAANQILPDSSCWHESFMLLIDELESQ